MPTRGPGRRVSSPVGDHIARTAAVGPGGLQGGALRGSRGVEVFRRHDPATHVQGPARRHALYSAVHRSSVRCAPIKGRGPDALAGRLRGVPPPLRGYVTARAGTVAIAPPHRRQGNESVP